MIEPSRRKFIQIGLTAAACCVSAPTLAAIPHIKGVRNLAFHNLHTDEKLRISYWKDGTYDRKALTQIDHILRDHYSGDVANMSPQLIDLLYDLQHKVNNDKPVEIISGYRSPKTNMVLARARDGIAKNSYHTRGMAMDIRMTGTPLPKIHNAALAMRRGGVGYYPDSQFVHIDVGPLRRW